MAIAPKRPARSLIMDKEYVRQLADELNRRIGFVPDPNATAEQAQQMMLASGIRPEDNEFSREIIRMRERDYPEEEEK